MERISDERLAELEKRLGFDGFQIGSAEALALVSALRAYRTPTGLDREQTNACARNIYPEGWVKQGAYVVPLDDPGCDEAREKVRRIFALVTPRPPKLGKFCDACQAIPKHGYCLLAGCPNAPEPIALGVVDSPSVGESEHEEHPCGLCDTSGRCTFACETADGVPAPTNEQRASAKYWSMLVLTAKVLRDLAEPDPQLTRVDQFRKACARLAAEVDEVVASPEGNSAVADASRAKEKSVREPEGGEG